MWLAAVAAARLGEDLLTESNVESFDRMPEEGLLLLASLLISKMKLTPKLVLFFRHIGAAKGHAQLSGLMSQFDVAAGIPVQGMGRGPRPRDG